MHEPTLETAQVVARLRAKFTLATLLRCLVEVDPIEAAVIRRVLEPERLEAVTAEILATQPEEPPSRGRIRSEDVP